MVVFSAVNITTFKLTIECMWQLQWQLPCIPPSISKYWHSENVIYRHFKLLCCQETSEIKNFNRFTRFSSPPPKKNNLHEPLLLASRIPDSVGKDIEKACQSIYPLHDVFVRKVKMLKKPKFECK